MIGKAALPPEGDPRHSKAKEVFSRKVYSPGAVIFRQGETALNAYMILRGEIDIWAVNDRGVQIHLYTMTKGQVFGEMALMTKGTRSATAVARTECELMVVKAAQFEKKLQGIDPLMRLWIQTLAQRIVATTLKAD